MFCNNQVALHIVNPMYHECTKYNFDVDCHLILEKIQARDFITSFVPSYLHLEDIFTKVFGSNVFKELTSKLNIFDIHAPT